MTHDSRLLFFVKNPVPGKVKSRLAKSIGDDEAARLYKLLASENLKRCALVKEIAITVYFDPPEAASAVKSWLSAFEKCEFMPQPAGDLGERLHHGFEMSFAGGAKKVIAVGSDTIGLSAGHIRQAIETVEKLDAVIGPAKDGGYYLLGFSRYRKGLLDGIPWSTPQVSKATVANLEGAGLRVSKIEMLEDLDDESNLQRLRQESGFTKNREEV